MVIPLILLAVCVLGLFFFLKGNSQRRISEINALEDEKNSLQSKYDFMCEQRRELKKLIEEKENELSRVKRGLEGIQTYTTKEMNLGEVDDSDKVSRYLVKEGKVTLEQDEKAKNKMETLKMDYLGACLTLGFIDIATAEKAAKINKLSETLKSS